MKLHTYGVLRRSFRPDELGAPLGVADVVLDVPPGIYRLTIALKDVASGRARLTNIPVEVPTLQPGVLYASSLMLADSLEPQPKIQDYAKPLTLLSDSWWYTHLIYQRVKQP